MVCRPIPSSWVPHQACQTRHEDADTHHVRLASALFARQDPGLSHHTAGIAHDEAGPVGEWQCQEGFFSGVLHLQAHRKRGR